MTRNVTILLGKTQLAALLFFGLTHVYCLSLFVCSSISVIVLRKHAYSNILKILQPKKEIFQIKNSDIFHISAQNIDIGYSLEPPRRGGSNEYSHSILAEIRKHNVYPCKPQFYYIKWGFRGSKLYRNVFVMV